MDYDTIVLGVGGIGSAVLCELAARGQSVLGLERFAIAHDRGSSHGTTRIIRRAYFEHPAYVPLVEDAYARWAALERHTGTTLLYRSGLVLVGLPESEVIQGVRAATEEHDLPITDLSIRELSQRFPGLRADEGMVALYEADAGYLLVEECVRAQVARATELGAKLRTGMHVLGWQTQDGRIEVRTRDQVYRANNLVVCGGPWSGQLLDDLRLPLVVLRKMQLWFEPTSDSFDVGRGAPVFCFDTVNGFFYGFPRVDDAGVKIAEHTGGKVVQDADTIDRALLPHDVEPVLRFMRDHIEGVHPQPRAHSACMYTMTPDGHPIVDRHPRHANVFIAAGFSGHGFKLAPSIGAMIADMIVGSAPSHDLMRLARDTLIQ